MSLISKFSANVMRCLTPTISLPWTVFMQSRLSSSCNFDAGKKPRPCSDFKKCKKPRKREVGCYRSSKIVQPCLKRKQTTFRPAANPIKSVWETDPPYQKHLKELPEHKFECVDPCRVGRPRLDALYYRVNKNVRKCQQTWVECPKLKIVPKCLCNFDEIKMEYEPRPPPCNDDKNKTCKSIEPEGCPRIRAPCCKRGRRPPSCFKTLKESGCRKRCCPFPSYSECCQKKPARIPVRPYECFCLAGPPKYCLLIRELKRLDKLGNFK